MQNRKRFRHRALSIVVSLVLLENSLPLSGMPKLFDITNAVTASAFTYTDESTWTDVHNYNFQSVVEFTSYCYWYSTNTNHFAESHQNDAISIAFNNSTLPNEFLGLGHSSYPFAGTVTFADTTSFLIASNRAFFSYVSDKAAISGSNGAENFTLVISRTQDVADGSSAPLLADHVVHDNATTAAKAWKIQAAAGSSTFSGAIGEIGSGALVDLTFTNNIAADIESKADTAEGSVPDAGLFCGTMGSDSVFTVKYSSPNPVSHSTSSASGNAGTFVGTVGDGAVLNVISDLTAISSDVTANGSEADGKGYAGGLVGYMGSSAEFHLKAAAAGNAERALSTLSVRGTVTGNNGVGGLYGKYSYGTAASLDLDSYDVNAEVYGKYCGGLFGVLETSGGFTVTSTAQQSHSYSSGTGTNHASDGYFGGVIGRLTATSLTDTILLQDLKIAPTASDSFGSFGGVIGIVDSAAYIRIKDVEVSAAGMAARMAADYFGGAVGTTSASSGVFIDLDNFKLSAANFYGGGVVGKFSNGVLRLTGTTDMTAAKPGGTASGSTTNGQLIGKNDNVLVYTPGGWTFKRANNAIADDLGTWGEVVRIADMESGIVTFDQTAHTVTVAAAVTAMATQSDLVKTALNMQLDSCGCLILPGARTTMLRTNLSLSDDLSFAGTGITGFMRDGGELTKIGCYTGTFNGNNHEITLAVGEKYGYNVTSSSDAEGIGQIYRHQYNGLFSVLGGNVSNLTLSHKGYINVRNCVDGMNIGGIAACSGGNVTLTKITANETINYHENANITGTEAAGKNIGGLIGFVGTNGNITVNGVSSVGANIRLSGRHQNWVVYGGAIGKVTAPTFTITIGTENDASNILTVGMKGDVSGVTSVGANADCGGLIGHITGSGSYASRIVNIYNLKFDDVTVGSATFTPTVANASNTNAGGFLGYAWLNTTANIKGLTVTKGTIQNCTTGGTAGGNANVGVMCYEATGKWIVDKLTVTAMTMSAGGSVSVGMLVNKAFKGNDGLYLDVLNAGYTLTAAALPSLAKFDEIAAYSAADADAVLAGGNGAGVISVNMNAARIGTNTRISARTVSGTATAGTGTYQNKLTGITCSQTSKFANPTARYYYNLDVMNSSDGGENLLLWSVSKYASDNIASEFKSTTAHPFGTTLDKTLSGTADMTGLSFYPLAKADGYTIGALDLTLDYSGIYTSAETINNSDDYIRDPGAANQHYLMHSGLFLNSTAGNSLTVSGALVLRGTFLEVGKYQGVLISDTMHGTFDSSDSDASVSLSGITPKTAGNAAYSDGYLLIHNIKRDNGAAIPTLKMYHVSTGTGYVNDDTAHATTKVAKSLIGAAEGSGLNIEFSLMKLDGRASYSDCPEAALFTAYNTYNSIFKTSTLLASVKTDQNAQLIYNYTVEDDWTNDRNVTYGKEIAMTSGCEYPDKEWQYFGSETYTNPISQNNGKYTNFSTFLPYVAVHFSAIDPNALYFRDLKVNVVATGLTVGCGTYNDPYIISENDQLMNVAAFLKNCTEASTLGKVTLPKTKPASMTGGDRWCTDKTGNSYHVTYSAANTFSPTVTGADTWSNAEVQSYLASAYYKVTANVTLGDGFVGLGDGTTGTDATAFHGVIVGRTDNTGAPAVTITNNSNQPFIKFANGCVVKDIIVSVGTDITRVQENKAYNNAYFGYYAAADNDENDAATRKICAYYGGIIGEIMGGDNIIDNSYVEFGSHTVTLSGTSGTIVPVGGYAGVVVFGGLIFKNMDARRTALNRTGLKVTCGGNTYNLADNSDDEAWAAIYVNPIVGRVINGYAVNETGGNAKDASGSAVTQYSYSEDGYYHDDAETERTGAVQHTLKNGKKHYPIADLNPNLTDKLDVTVTSGSEQIDIPNAQAMFVLSLITQSGAGTAEDADESYPDAAPSLSYGTYSSKVYGMSRIASYSNVGTNDASFTAISDYDSFARYDTAANTAVPYIIRHYTSNETKMDVDESEVIETTVTSTQTAIESFVESATAQAIVSSATEITSYELTTTTTTTIAAGNNGASARKAATTQSPEETPASDDFQKPKRAGVIVTTQTVTETTTTRVSATTVIESTSTSTSFTEYTEISTATTSYYDTDAAFSGAVDDLDGKTFVIANNRVGSNRYLQCNNFSHSGRVAQKQAPDLKDATEIHFEKQANGKYRLSFDVKNGDTTTVYYLKLKMTSSSDGQGGLELVLSTESPSEFTIEKISENGATYWGIKDASLSPNLYINNDDNRNRGYRAYKKNSSNTGYDAGNKLILYKRKLVSKETKTITTKRITTTWTTVFRKTIITFTDISRITLYKTRILPIYPARCVTKSGAYYDIELTGSGTYHLPDSFRGLGCVGNNNDLYAMKVNTFDGKGLTIDEDIYLNKFQTDNYFNVIHSVTTQATNTGSVYGVNKEQDHHGIGLFDSIITSGAASKITGFTLKGSVNTEIYKDTYADSDQEQTIYANAAAKFISVGGVCGSSNPTGQYLNFDQIVLNSLSVCGSCIVGGLLGYSNNQSGTIPVNITKCSAVNLSIKMNSSESLSSEIQARNAMGGFVGKCVEGMVVIEGDTTNRSSVTLKSFGYETLAGVTDHRTVCGGLVGFAGNGCTVKNTNVSPTAGCTVEIGSDYTGYAGGLVGLMQPYTDKDPGNQSCVAVFQNCTVEKINVNGHYAGGFYGGKWINNYSPYRITLDNCQMIGNTAANNTIKGNSLRDAEGYAGGFLGCGNVYTNGSPNITIKDCKVSHYTITSTAYNDGQKGYVGGFIGYTGSFAADSSITCYIHDSSVEYCTIGTTGNYAGGAIGRVARQSTNSKNKILGYNIKLDTVTLGGANNGAWIGHVANNDNTTSIQFAGLGVHGNGFAQNVGNRSNFTNASFVFADYDGACAGMNESNKQFSTFNASADTNVPMPNYPYVNVNPQSALGSGEVISGDGAVLLDSSAPAVSGFTGTGKKTMAAKIYSEMNTAGTAKQYYTTFKNSNADIVSGSGNKIDYYMNRRKTDEGDRISTFATERGQTAAELAENGVDDFAVLVIANTNDTETTDLINRYIQLVTNTTNNSNYAENSEDGYYHVDIKTCQYNANAGSFSITNASQHGIVKTTKNGVRVFSLNNDYADSIYGTFTLLDVQFMDPMNPKTDSDAGKIAYHLYVPVYTVREMAVKFYTAAKTGAHSVAYHGANQTNQYAALINECVIEQNTSSDVRNKRKHADTLDTWVTQYIRYEYAALDINALLNSGNVNWNYNKVIDFETHIGAADKKRLPAGTYMVLVDPNGNSDQVYYTTAGTDSLIHYTVDDTTESSGKKDCWKVPLSAFKAEDFDGNDQNNASFSVPTINDVIARSIVSVTNTSNTGWYHKLTAAETAGESFAYDVYAIENGVKTYYAFRAAKNGDTDLSVSGAVFEDYYISVKVPKASAADNDVYYYQIKVPSDRFQISDIDNVRSNKMPSSAGITQQNDFEVLIAELFNQTGTMEVLPDVQQITNTNHTITAKLSSTITPKSPSAIYYLNSDSFFHSFYITLVRTSEKGIENDIKALDETDVSATYRLNSGEAITCADIDLNLKDNYLNVQTASASQSGNLLTLLREGDKRFTISADIVMNFDQDELPDEFPKRSAGEEYGVNVRAASNIAYESSSLAHTSMTNPYPIDRHNYYIETVKSASLKYSPHADEIDTVYDEIGYNSKNQTTLGVNGISAENAERTDMPVNTQAFYNVQLVSDSELEEARVLKLTFKLEKKTDTGSAPVTGADYAEIAAMQNYIAGNIVFRSKDAAANAAAAGSTVTVYLNAADCDYAGKLFKIDISFHAKSGGSFIQYANYKVDLKADLYKTAITDGSGNITGVDNESLITSSSAEDYLIYTNAKINPQFIRISPVTVTGSKATLAAYSIPTGATSIKVDGVSCADISAAQAAIDAINDELDTHTLTFNAAS